jgi:hypothetical protein
MQYEEAEDKCTFLKIRAKTNLIENRKVMEDVSKMVTRGTSRMSLHRKESQ